MLIFRNIQTAAFSRPALLEPHAAIAKGSRELRNDLVRRLRNILAVLITAADMSGVIRPPG